MRKCIFALMFAAVCGVCFAQQVVVMVMPFKVEENAVTKAEAATITRVFRGRLSNQTSGVMTVLNIENVQARMDAMKWESGDWSNNEKKARLNEAFNANYLIIGTISKGRNEGDIIIDATAEDGNMFVIVGSTDERVRKNEDYYDVMAPLVSKMVESINKGRGAVPRAASATPEVAAPRRNAVTSRPNSTANEKKRILIPTFTHGQGVSAEEAELITRTFISQVMDTGRIAVVASADMIMREQRFQMSDLYDTEKTTRLGYAADANYLITGEIRRLVGSYLLMVQMLNIKTASIVGSSDTMFERINQVGSIMPEFVSTIVKYIVQTEGP